MKTTFDQLRELLVLSGKPVDTGTAEQWAQAHERLHGRFPVDYLQFVSAFGYCLIDDHVRVLNPFDERGGFWDQLGRERAIDREDIEVTPPEDPAAFYPRPKEMIPWGSTDDGGAYLWATDDEDPDRWTVFVEWDLSSEGYRLGMEEFLLAGLRGQLDAFAFGAGFPTTLPVYVDPAVDMARANVRLDPPVPWDSPQVEALCRIFELGPPSGNSLIVRPNRWKLVWHAGSLTIETFPDQIEAPKAHVAALAAALKTRIVDASPESWADMVL